MTPEQLRAAALKVERSALKQWVRDVVGVRRSVDVDKVAGHLSRGKVDEALALLNPTEQTSILRKLQESTLPLREVGWAAGAEDAGVRGFVALGKYAQAEPTVVAYLEEQSLARVRDLTRTVRATAREILAQGARQGLNPRETAVLLRDTIGLHPRQAIAVSRYAARLREQGAYSAAEVERYATRQLRVRAETIARTETLQSLNEGRRAVWGELQRTKKLDNADWIREWVIAEDERTCERCLPFDSVRAFVGEPFEADGDESMGPPLHPRCRCVERLVPYEPGDE